MRYTVEKIITDSIIGYNRVEEKINKDGKYIDYRQISDFILNPILGVDNDDKTEYHVDMIYFNRYKKETTKRIIFNGNDFVTVKAFKSKLVSQILPVYFIGSDNDLELIKSILIKECTTFRQGISFIGLLKNEDKWIYIDKNTNSNDFVVSDSVTLDCSINQKNIDEIDIPKTLNFLKEFLFGISSKNITYTILCSIFNCFFKARYENLKFKIPITCLLGEAGAGKSSILENIIIPIFGNNNLYGESAANIKEFASFKTEGESNFFPHIIEEYKDHMISIKIKKFVSSLIRSNYDGHTLKRGHQDQSVTEYKLKSPLFIVGETNFDETALRERFLTVIFSKKDHNEFNSKALEMLKRNEKHLNDLGTLMLDYVLSIEDSEIYDIYDSIKQQMEAKNLNLPDRIKHNICISNTSYQFLANLFNMHNVKIKSDILDILIDGQIDFNLSGNNSNSVIENVLETFSMMIDNNILLENTDYYVKDKTILCIRMKQAYTLLTKFIKDYSIETEIYKKCSDFVAQLKRTQYFIDDKLVRNPEKWNVGGTKKDIQRCFMLDLSKMDKLDFSLYYTYIGDYEKTEREGIQNESNLKVL